MKQVLGFILLCQSIMATPIDLTIIQAKQNGVAQPAIVRVGGNILTAPIAAPTSIHSPCITQTSIKPPVLPTNYGTPTEIVAPTNYGTPTEIVAPTNYGTPTEIVVPTNYGTLTEIVVPTNYGTPTEIVVPTNYGTPTEIVAPTNYGTAVNPTGIIAPTNYGPPSKEYKPSLLPVETSLPNKPLPRPTYGHRKCIRRQTKQSNFN